MIGITPVFRNEIFLSAAVNKTTPPTPFFNEEFYLAKIAGLDVPLPNPTTRREHYLAKLAGESIDLPTPVTRDEMFLAYACEMDVDVPEPKFRDEFFLAYLAWASREDSRSDIVDVGRVDFMIILT